MQPDDKTNLIEALRGFETLMVATNASNGKMHARPMVVAEVDDAGEVWFVTDKDSHKLDEVGADASALVTGQAERSYVSVTGELDVINDPQRLAALWRPAWHQWFAEADVAEQEPHPQAVLVRLRPEIGEYWVARMVGSVRYFFDATRSLFDGTGAAPPSSRLEHAKVPL